MMMMIERKWVDICPIEAIPERGCRVVHAQQGQIAIFRTATGEIFALENRCPHKGGPLSEGIVHGLQAHQRHARGRHIQCQGQAIELATQRAQQRQELRRRHVDAAPRLHRFDENSADPFAAKNPAQRLFQCGQFSSIFWKCREMPELAQLGPERAAKMAAVRGIERAVAQPVIRPLKGDHAAFAGREHRRLQRSLHGFEA